MDEEARNELLQWKRNRLRDEIRELEQKLNALRTEFEDLNGEYVPIGELDLSVKTYNALKRDGYETVQSVMRYAFDYPEHLLKTRNFGRLALLELQAKLRKHGYVPSAENGGGS